MDFWREKSTGKLYSHALVTPGVFPAAHDGPHEVEGVVYHDAKTHKPRWMAFAEFKMIFEHVELRTSQEAWAGGAHWWWLLWLMSVLIGGSMLIGAITGWYAGMELRPWAWPVVVVTLCFAVFAFRRSRRMERDYQWDSWRRELKTKEEGDVEQAQ